jgi:hypothetical protein
MGRSKKTAAATGRISEDLASLKAEFDQWRATRTTGKRIPPELWAGAVDMATRHGLHQVADVLHLDYAGLKRRMELGSSGQQPVAPEASAPQFVEMIVPTPMPMPMPMPMPTPTPMPMPMPMPPQAPTVEPVRAECVVELANARGTTMRIELSGAGVASLSALCNAFCAAA